MNSKVAIGQCYEYKDKVYMIVEGPYTMSKNLFHWRVINTLTKQIDWWNEGFILKLQRPFQNFG